MIISPSILSESYPQTLRIPVIDPQKPLCQSCPTQVDPCLQLSQKISPSHGDLPDTSMLAESHPQTSRIPGIALQTPL